MVTSAHSVCPGMLFHCIAKQFVLCGDCRYSALETTQELLPYIGEALETLLERADCRGDESKADSLKSAIMKFHFIYTLVVVCQVMSVTKELCVQMQGKLLLLQICLALAIYLVHKYCALIIV